MEREVEGDLFMHDIGQGFGFRPGSFDGAIRYATQSFDRRLLISLYSISVLQWLLNAETSHPMSSPPHRLNRFFTTLHSALRNPSRAVFQFYPSSDDQIQLITSSAQKAGFGGGIVVDYPNSNKARKVFLCLLVGGGGAQQQIPKGLEGEEDETRAKFERRRDRERGKEKKGKRKSIKDKDWILNKKEVRFYITSIISMTMFITRQYFSCIGSEEKRTFHAIRSILVGSGEQSFDECICSNDYSTKGYGSTLSVW